MGWASARQLSPRAPAMDVAVRPNMRARITVRGRTGSRALGSNVTVTPGDTISLTEVAFTYAGPAGTFAVGFAAKLDVGALGTAFNNGAIVPSDLVSISSPGLQLPDTPMPGAPIDFIVGDANFITPAIESVHPLFGGGTGIAHAQMALWVWIVDYTLLQATLGGQGVLSDWLAERFIPIDGNAGRPHAVYSSLVGSIPFVTIQ